MSKRIVTIDDATGNVVSEWRGGDDQGLIPVAGRTHCVVTDEENYSGKRWNGTAFEPRVSPAAVPSQLDRIEAKLDELLTRGRP